MFTMILIFCSFGRTDCQEIPLSGPMDVSRNGRIEKIELHQVFTSRAACERKAEVYRHNREKLVAENTFLEGSKFNFELACYNRPTEAPKIFYVLIISFCNIGCDTIYERWPTQQACDARESYVQKHGPGHGLPPGTGYDVVCRSIRDWYAPGTECAVGLPEGLQWPENLAKCRKAENELFGR